MAKVARAAMLGASGSLGFEGLRETADLVSAEQSWIEADYGVQNPEGRLLPHHCGRPTR